MAEKRRNFSFGFLFIIIILGFFDIPGQLYATYHLPVELGFQRMFYPMLYIYLLYLLLTKRLGIIFDIPLIWVLLLYFICILVSDLSSEKITFLPEYLSPTRHLITTLTFILLYGLITCIVRSFKDLHTLIRGLIIAGVIFALWTTFSCGKEIYRGLQLYQPSYSYLHFLSMDSNTYAYLLDILIIFAVGTAWAEKSCWLKCICYPVIFLFCYDLILTGSRGAILALLGGFLSILCFSRWEFIRAVSVVVILIFIITIMTFNLDTILKVKFANLSGIESFEPTFISDISARGRILNIYLSLEKFMERPFLGWGGNCLIGITPALGIGSNHLFYLRILAENGIFAFGFFSLFLLASVYLLWKVSRVFKKLEDRQFMSYYIFIPVLIIVMIKGFFAPLYFADWITMGMAMAFYKMVRCQSFTG